MGCVTRRRLEPCRSQVCRARPAATASYWISGSADINLNEDINWTDGPLVETDACTPASPGAPVAGTDIGVTATWQAIAEGSGWRVQVRAARDLGLVSSTADYSGGLWGSVTSLRALRSPPASCPTGETAGGRGLRAVRGLPSMRERQFGHATALRDGIRAGRRIGGQLPGVRGRHYANPAGLPEPRRYRSGGYAVHTGGLRRR